MSVIHISAHAYVLYLCVCRELFSRTVLDEDNFASDLLYDRSQHEYKIYMIAHNMTLGLYDNSLHDYTIYMIAHNMTIRSI